MLIIGVLVAMIVLLSENNLDEVMTIWLSTNIEARLFIPAIDWQRDYFVIVILPNKDASLNCLVVWGVLPAVICRVF